MDNLDRTNVAQSAIARWTLVRQLRDVGILRQDESVESYVRFLEDFRNGMCVCGFFFRVRL